MDRLKKKAFSTYYNIRYFLQADRHQKQKLVLYSTHFTSTHSPPYHHFLYTLILFTYRQAFLYRQQLTQDTGYGCMIRVCQMMIANALQRYQKRRFLYPNKKTERSDLTYILSLFLEEGMEGNPGKLSIIRFWDVAKEFLDMGPQQYYSSKNACQIAEILMARESIKGYEGISLLTFENTLYLEEVLESITDNKRCTCSSSTLSCHLCLPFKKPLILTVVTAVCGALNANHFDIIKDFMSLKCTMGIMGGSQGRAFYFIGFCQGKLVYLDPHKVQRRTQYSRLKSQLGSFFTDELRTISYEQISSNLTLCFLIETRQDLKQLLDTIDSHSKRRERLATVERRREYCDSSQARKKKAKKEIMRKQMSLVESQVRLDLSGGMRESRTSMVFNFIEDEEFEVYEDES